MNTIAIRDIRQHLSEVIHDAEAGEETVITRYGKPVAKLVPIETEQQPFPDMEEFRKTVKVKSGKINSTELISQMREEERY